MSRATPYDRQFSFALFSAEKPLVPHSGVSLDAEFNSVKLALDETQQNIRLIQDDDGVLKRGSVGRAQFDSSISIGFAAPASWQPSTTYDAEVSTVFYASKFYICTSTHVSGPAFDAGNWEPIADFTIAAIIDDGSVASAKLADGAVGANKIADGSISNSKLASGAVSTAKLGEGSVTTSKIADAIALASMLLPAGLGPIPWSLPMLPPGWDWADGGTLLPSTPYPALRAVYIAAGFPHGQDGSGNPKKPDMRGRVAAGQDNFGLLGNAARLSAAMASTAIGSAGGSASVSLVTGNLPPYTPAGIVPIHDPGHGHTTDATKADGTTSNVTTGAVQGAAATSTVNASTTGITATFVGNPQGGTSAAFAVAQPTMVLPMIIKAH